jgi:hypothetical protein
LDDVSGSAYSGARNFDFSQAGAFFYRRGTVGNSQVISFLNGDRNVQPLRTDPGQYFHPRFSPDGERLAFTLVTDHGAEVWVQDVKRSEAWRRPFGENSAAGMGVASSMKRVAGPRRGCSGLPSSRRCPYLFPAVVLPRSIESQSFASRRERTRNTLHVLVG